MIWNLIAALAWICVATAPAQVSWAPIGTLPSGFLVADMAFDEARDRVVGHSHIGSYEFDGQTWSAVSTSVTGGGILRYDAVRQRVVLYHVNAAVRETWEWDGTLWALRDSNTPDFDLLAYHRSRGRVMGFGGGFNGTRAGNDLYEWNGSTWDLIPTTNKPPRQHFGINSWTYYHTMAYDARRGRLCICGSYRTQGTAGTAVADTWEWEAATGWMNPSAGGPSIATDLVFDAHRGVLMMREGSPANVMWEWDGVGSWRQLATGAQTGWRYCYDSKRGRTLTVTGFAPSPQTLWALTPDHPAPYERHGDGCAGPGTAGPELALRAPWTRAWLQAPWPFEVALSNLPLSIGMLAMGFGDQQHAGLPLPIDLAALGMPGCFLRIAGEATLFVSGSGGRATVSLTLPPNAALLGQVFFQQGFALAPGANAAGILATPSFRGAIGRWR